MTHSHVYKQSWARFAPTILRFGLGIIFAVHGYQKVFMQGFGGVGEFFSSLGIPAAMFFAYVVSLLELIGGLFLILGIFVRWTAAFLAIDMAVAALLVHLPKGFSVSNGGYEFTLLLFFGLLSLLFSGAGEWSLYSCSCTVKEKQQEET